jgi:hypothetical protein
MAMPFVDHFAYVLYDYVIQSMLNLEITWCNVAHLGTQMDLNIGLPAFMLQYPFKEPFQFVALQFVRLVSEAPSCPNIILHVLVAQSLRHKPEMWINLITVATRGTQKPVEASNTNADLTERQKMHLARKAKHNERALVKRLLVVVVVTTAPFCNWCAVKAAKDYETFEKPPAFIVWQDMLLVFLLYFTWLMLDDRGVNAFFQFHPLFICTSFLMEGELLAHFFRDYLDSFFDTIVLLAPACLVSAHYSIFLTMKLYDYLLRIEKCYVSCMLVVLPTMTLTLHINDFTNASAFFLYVTKMLILARIFALKKDVHKIKETFHAEAIDKAVSWAGRTAVFMVVAVVWCTTNARDAAGFKKMLDNIDSKIGGIESFLQT